VQDRFTLVYAPPEAIRKNADEVIARWKACASQFGCIDLPPPRKPAFAFDANDPAAPAAPTPSAPVRAHAARSALLL
jgi:hypothetical protein